MQGRCKAGVLSKGSHSSRAERKRGLSASSAQFVFWTQIKKSGRKESNITPKKIDGLFLSTRLIVLRELGREGALACCSVGAKGNGVNSSKDRWQGLKGRGCATFPDAISYQAVIISPQREDINRSAKGSSMQTASKRSF